MSVEADGVETDDGGDGGEDTEAEDDNEADFFAAWALYFEEGWNRNDEDPDVGDDVDRACAYWVSR